MRSLQTTLGHDGHQLRNNAKDRQTALDVIIRSETIPEKLSVDTKVPHSITGTRRERLIHVDIEETYTCCSVGRPRKDVVKQSRVINSWNNLPPNIVLAGTLNSFKNLLNKHWEQKIYSTR